MLRQKTTLRQKRKRSTNPERIARRSAYASYRQRSTEREATRRRGTARSAGRSAVTLHRYRRGVQFAAPGCLVDPVSLQVESYDVDESVRPRRSRSLSLSLSLPFSLTFPSSFPVGWRRHPPGWKSPREYHVVLGNPGECRVCVCEKSNEAESVLREHASLRESR